MKPKLSKKQLFLLFIAFVFNAFVYGAGRIIAQNFEHYCLETPWDLKIPIISWTIIIYLGCYIFWAYNYCICIAHDKGGGYRFFTAHLIGEAVCFACFVFFPTAVYRPEIVGNTVFDELMRLTYGIDAADNLFPSLHCFISWMCWIGVRRNKSVPKWYQAVSFLLAAAVCISTLTVKQHVIADVPAGILLAELSYLLAGFIDKKYQKSIIKNEPR